MVNHFFHTPMIFQKSLLTMVSKVSLLTTKLNCPLTSFYRLWMVVKARSAKLVLTQRHNYNISFI